MSTRLSLDPGTLQIKQFKSVRSIYIQNLADLVHVCILRGELDRARRGWGILVRCREVDWKSKWNIGLYLLTPRTENTGSASQYYTQAESYLEPGRTAERYLKGLLVSAIEADKPMMLHALVLHFIKDDQHRAALDELETYLPSYPYLLSGPLHTYAGMLAFYLAQPKSSRPRSRESTQRKSDIQLLDMRQAREMSVRSETTEGTVTLSVGSGSLDEQDDVVHPGLVRQARGYFARAIAIDRNDDVAAEFIRMIDQPNTRTVISDDEEDRESLASDQETGNVVDSDDRSDSQGEDEKYDDEKYDEEDDGEVYSQVSASENPSVGYDRYVLTESDSD